MDIFNRKRRSGGAMRDYSHMTRLTGEAIEMFAFDLGKYAKWNWFDWWFFGNIKWGRLDDWDWLEWYDGSSVSDGPPYKRIWLRHKI